MWVSPYYKMNKPLLHGFVYYARQRTDKPLIARYSVLAVCTIPVATLCFSTM
ncbi:MULTISPECIES: hypothetical protein [unclassified Arsukibacterium]|uniref:hypothetical protein n=1 Tax=unclassified Arsukibacterium TaxID=2635278 RepID=UPI0025BA27C4|nr:MULTISPECIES: hypothetical protein [unclassified Arsukibacterium]